MPIDHHTTPEDYKEPIQHDCHECGGNGKVKCGDRCDCGCEGKEYECENCGGKGYTEQSHEDYEQDCLDDKADLDHDDI